MLWKECGIECEDTHEGEGVVQRYVHLTREFEAPTSYHVFSLLAAVAAATSRRVVIDRGIYRLWPNLYVLLHGPSGLGKGIASGHAMDFMRAAVGEEGLQEYPEDMTGEGLFRLMKEQTEGGQPSMGLVYSDEFSELLGGQDYKSEFAKRLTRLYGCPDKTGVGRAGTGATWAKHVFLNIIGCSQEDWLRTLPLHAIKGGLFARILTIPEDKKRHWKFRGELDREMAGELAREIGERVLDIGDGGIARETAEAYEMAEAWYMGEEKRWKELHPIVLPWCERRMDHAVKLAYILSLLEGQEGPLVIGGDATKRAIGVVEWLTPRIQAAFLRMDESKSGELIRVLMGMIEHHGGEMKEQYIRAGLGNKFSKGQVDEALSHLIVTEWVERRERQGGRRGSEWWIVDVRGERDGD